MPNVSTIDHSCNVILPSSKVSFVVMVIVVVVVVVSVAFVDGGGGGFGVGIAGCC